MNSSYDSSRSFNNPITASDLPLHVPGQSLASSEHMFWRGFLLRRYLAPACGAAAPALNEYWVLIHRSEASNVAVKAAGSWQKTYASPGSVTIIPKGASSEWYLEKPVEALHLYIQPTVVAQIMEQVVDADPSRLELFVRLGAHDPLIQHIGLALLKEIESGTPFSGLYAESLVQTLTMHLIRHHSTLRLPSLPISGGLTAQKLRRILEYVNDHLERDITLADLSDVAEISPFHLTRQFKQSMGITPHQYLIDRRIEVAKHLLATTQLSIAEIAYHVGLSSQSHLTTLFRKRVGMTPAVYRNAR